MSNPYFHFKQFTVYHDRCAMKVGTDGVLLGAWADVHDSLSIMDIGAGTGLIAMMLSQRNLQAHLTAIDIDEDAVNQATENVSKSPFTSQIVVKSVSLQDFAEQTAEKFDHLVTNPPFFIDSLRSPDEARSRTRHAETLTLNHLFSYGRKLIADGGKLSLILPSEQRDTAESLAGKNRWFISRVNTVYPLPQAKPKRVLMEFSTQPVENIVKDELTIESSHLTYTPEFVSLVKDFYLYL